VENNRTNPTRGQLVNTSTSTMSAPVSANIHYRQYLPQWQLVRDCVEGESCVKARAETYLPRLSARQKDAAYLAYKQRARFFNATERTLSGWLGSIFRKDPSIHVPPQAEELLLDVDLCGATIEEFAASAVEEVLITNRAGVLVEHQTSPNGRPYLLLFTAEEIVDWGETLRDGVRVLSLVVLQYVTNDVDASGASCELVERRTLRLVDGFYEQTIERSVAGEFTIHGIAAPIAQSKRLNFIPFVFLSSKGTKSTIHKSPLLDIARTNLHHYTSSADWRQGLHMVALPTPYGLNLSKGDGPLELGPGVFQEFDGGSGAAVGFLEISGSGLNLVRQDLEDLKGEMAALGAAYVTPPKREAETAEALTLKHAEQNSPLAKIARSVEKGLTRALEYLCQWYGVDTEEVEVRLNKDFDRTRLSPSDLKVLSEALQGGAITAEVYAYQLEQAEVLPPEMTAAQLVEGLAGPPPSTAPVQDSPAPA